MVEVGVGDESSGNGFSGIEIPVDVWEVDPVTLLDFPTHRGALDPFAIKADSSWTDEYEGEQC